MSDEFSRHNENLRLVSMVPWLISVIVAGPDTPEWLHLRQPGQAVVVALAYVKLDNVTRLETWALTSTRMITRSFHTIVGYLKHLSNFTLCWNLITPPWPGTETSCDGAEREAVRRQLMVSLPPTEN